MNWKRLIFWVKVAAAMSIFLPCAIFVFHFVQEINVLSELISPTIQRQSLSDGMELRQINLRGGGLSNDLYIPSRYIVQISNNEDGGVDFVKLRFSYEEFIKFSTDTPTAYPAALADVRDGRDEVFLDISNGRLRKEAWGDWPAIDIWHLHKDSATVNGLYVYRKENEAVGDLRVMVPVEQQQADHISIQQWNGLTGDAMCSEAFFVDNRFSANVLYNWSYLDNWKIIDRDLRMLIRRFSEKPR